MKDITFLEELEKRLNKLVEEINSVNNPDNKKNGTEPEIHNLLGKINSEIELINGPNFNVKDKNTGLTEPINRYMDY